ncbi:MAG TPA: TonB-dependent receptor plug domain-containing protein, partial [Burkholderiaceae bacterium]|nr:TonB-dependent receptor plug domain-containing protein [Burkholderiaceae bacterium]
MFSCSSYGVSQGRGWPRHALALAAMCVCNVAWATDESASPGPVAGVLSEVVVRARAEAPLPEVASPLREAEGRAMRAASSDTARLLQGVPGVALYGAGGLSSLPVIHGLADDRLRIQVDGMDLVSACANHMNPPLSYLDPSQVRQVRVWAGIAPVSAGGDSIGGTIQVDSAEPVFAAPGEGPLRQGEAGLYYRSNGHAYGGHLAATWTSEQFSLRYHAATAQADNHRAGDAFKPAGLAAAGRGWLAADEVGSTAYESRNQSLALGWRQDRHLWELKLGVQDVPYQGFANQRMDMTGNDSTQFNLRYQGRYDWGQWEARAWNEHTRHRMQFGDDKLYWYGSTVAGMPMDTDGHNSGLNVKADVALNERDLLRVGGGWQRYRLDDWWLPSGGMMMAPNTFWNINGGERDRLALFGEWEARWSERWLTLFGVRHEQVDMAAGAVQGYNGMYSSDALVFNAAQRQRQDHNLDLVALARFTPSTEQHYEFGYAMKTRSPNLY